MITDYAWKGKKYMRDVKKDIEKAKNIISSHRGMTVLELSAIADMSSGLYSALRNSFMFGFMVGYRQRADEQKGKRK